MGRDHEYKTELTEREEEVCRLAILLGYTQSEAASTLGISKGRV